MTTTEQHGFESRPRLHNADSDRVKRSSGTERKAEPRAEPRRAVWMRQYQARWLRARRDAALAKLGGCCARCQATDRLEVDHIDPASKVSHRMWSWSQARLDAELAKCQLLCVRCHRAKTRAELARPIPHGTSTGYRRGCRCDACTHGVMAARRKPRNGLRVHGHGEIIGVSVSTDGIGKQNIAADSGGQRLQSQLQSARALLDACDGDLDAAIEALRLAARGGQ